MSDRKELDFLKDMYEAARRAQEFCSSLEFEDFLEDLKTQDAVIRNIEIIGEAAKNISNSTRSTFPDIPWKQISGMRDRLIHHYFGVNIDIVWQVVKNDLASLTTTLAHLQ